MAHRIDFAPRYWLQATDETWYPAPWWGHGFPLLDAFADPTRVGAEESARARELRQIVDHGGLVRSTEPHTGLPVSDAVRAVYARAGVAHLLSPR